MKNLLTRSLTGTLFVVVMVTSLLHLYSTLALFLLIILSGTYEFYTILKKGGYRPFSLPGLLIAMSIYTSIVLTSYSIFQFDYLILIISLELLSLLVIVFSNRPHPLVNSALTFFGVIYFTFPVSLFVITPLQLNAHYNYQILLGFFIILWCYDSFAYLTGITIGKHKLFESISPKKTWEGLLGGVVFSLISAWIVSLRFDQLSLVHWLSLSIIISTMGTLGDLTASKFKRSLDIKDSGSIFPGHGGIIDRFDSFLFAAPAVFIYLAVLAS